MIAFNQDAPALQAEISIKQALHFADSEFLDIALGIRWSMMVGTVVVSVVRSFNVWPAIDSPEKMDVL